MITAASLNSRRASFMDFGEADIQAIKEEMLELTKPKFNADRNFLPGVEMIEQLTAENDQAFNICMALVRLRQNSDMPESVFQKFEDMMYENTAFDKRDVRNIRKRTRKHGFGTIHSIRIGDEDDK